MGSLALDLDIVSLYHYAIWKYIVNKGNNLGIHECFGKILMDVLKRTLHRL
jgi:hypothetical protein